MPIRLADLRKETRSITFEFLGETVHVAYSPGAFTPELEAEANAAEPGHQLGALAKMFARILASWDVMDDDGQPLPITLDTLMVMPAKFLGAIMKALQDDTTVPKESGGSFAASS